MARIALNGRGRIGKLVLRALIDSGAGGEIMFLNDADGTSEQRALLLDFNSVHGRWQADIGFDEGLTINGQRMAVTAAKRIEDSPLTAHVGRSGHRLHQSHQDDCRVALYYAAGVRKVVVAAPIKYDALSLVDGVNHASCDPARHHLVTAASCTTNCLAPVVKVIREAIGIKHGSISTIHYVTNTQTIVDRPAKDMGLAAIVKRNPLEPLGVQVWPFRMTH